MIRFCDGIKHLYLPHLNEVNQTVNVGINDWLKKGADYFVSQNQISNDFTISTYDYFDFLNPYAYDVNRISCASIESLKEIERKNWQPKSIGWNITKFYYSAFFSAHTILKVVGKSLSNIETLSLDKVRNVTSNYGLTYGNLSSGLYCIVLNPSNNSFRFYKDSLYDNSHEGLWKYFLHFLTVSQNSVYGQLPQADAQLFIDKMNELISALKNWNSQNGNWLSRVRNSVNYSHTFGIWFPYKEYAKEYDSVYNYLDLHLDNPLLIDLKSFKGKDLLYFVRTCQLINAIAMDLLMDLETKHPSNKSFIKNGLLKFKNLYT